MKNEADTATSKRPSTAAFLLLAMLVLGGSWAGWSWWKGTGPFRNRHVTRPNEYVDHLAGVEYVDAAVSFGEFLDPEPLERWTDKEEKRVPWTGEKIRTYPPFIPDLYGLKHAIPDRERERAIEARREMERSLAGAAMEQGFRRVPYRSANAEEIDQSLVAHLRTKIKSCRQNGLVIFQAHTTLDCYVRVESQVFQIRPSLRETGGMSAKPGPAYKQSVLEGMTVGSRMSPVYVVEAEKAMEGMNAVMRRQANDVFKDSRSALTTPVDHKLKLERNFEADAEPAPTGPAGAAASFRSSL